MEILESSVTLEDALSRYSQAINDLVGFGLQQGNIVGSLGELLACNALGLTHASSNTKGYDATDEQQRKYQIKTRVATPGRAIQLGVVRDLHAADFVIAVVLSTKMEVINAWEIPARVFESHARRSGHVNGWLLTLRSVVLDDPLVRNIKEHFVCQTTA